MMSNLLTAIFSRGIVINKPLLFVSLLIFLTGSFLIPLGDAVAKGKGKGPDKSQVPSERPPGWDKGEKKGWDSDVPPGLEGKWKEEGDEKGGKGERKKKSKVEEKEKGKKNEGKGKQKKEKD